MFARLVSAQVGSDKLNEGITRNKLVKERDNAFVE